MVILKQDIENVYAVLAFYTIKEFYINRYDLISSDEDDDDEEEFVCCSI